MILENARIDGIELYEVKIPLKIPFQISGGVSYFRKSLIVVLHSGKYVGYGEAAPFEEPYYSSETISSVKMLYLEFLFKRILGKEIDSIEHINDILSKGVRGNNFAKAGIENAYWDLLCDINKISLKELITDKLKQLEVNEEYINNEDYIESGVSVGIPIDNSIDTLKQWVREYIEEGYKRIKIKIKPGWDINALKAVREAIGDFPLWTDSNSSFDFETHKDMFKAMDEYNCLFHEQPLNHDDILDHSKLARYIKTPICLDESLKSSMIGAQALELGASCIWNVKIQRIGGLLEGLKIYKLATNNNVKLWGGTMPESGIGAIPIMNLSSFKGFCYPADVEASERWYGKYQDIVEINMNKQGQIYLPKCNGIKEIINWNNFKNFTTKIYSSK